MQDCRICHQTPYHKDIKFDLPARDLIPSVVREVPQISTGRSADVEENEGLPTPTEERGDLLIKHQTDCILDVILMHHVGNLFPMSGKRRTIFEHGVLGNEAKVVLQYLAGSLNKKSGKAYSETSNFNEVEHERCNCASHTSIHLRITHPQPYEPTTPVGRWSRP